MHDCFSFTCEHRKIIFPLLAFATGENEFSLLTSEIKKHLTLTRT